MLPNVNYVVVSHRGACGYVPEHSINAYELAIELGTDYIEPDLCLSKDGTILLSGFANLIH
jgi:glycerophosphoryl diester phosphodiesterase